MLRFETFRDDESEQDFNLNEGTRKETYPKTIGLKVGLKILLGDGGDHDG